AVLNLSRLVAAVLAVIFVAPAVYGGTESEQADPNAPKDKVRGYQAERDLKTGKIRTYPVYEDQKEDPVTYRVKTDASGEPMKDEEGNFIFTAEPNEARAVPPVAPPWAGPQQPPASRPGLRRHAVDIGPEIYHFKYEEPAFPGFPGIKEEGTFYGLRFGYTSRDWVPASPKVSPSDGGGMFRAEGRFAFGQVDYDGATQGGSPLTFDNQDDFAFEGRLLLGGDMLRGDTLNTLYAGIGYRYLYDDLGNGGPAGYERESNYLYVPLGYQFDSSHKVGWSFGFGAEFDVFIVGMQRSHVYPVLENRQNSGYGYRASVRFQHKSQDAIITIEPFFRYWDIDDSEVEPGGYEPANETTEFGIQLIWLF
ncbi:MAG: hypothetical protein ABIF19_00170, partial [Planctomycetota bacterium]